MGENELPKLQQVRLINKIIAAVSIAAILAWGATIIDFRVHEREDTMRFIAIEHVLKMQTVGGVPIVEKITKNTQIIEDWVKSSSIMYTHLIEEVQSLKVELARHHAQEEAHQK